MLLIKVIIKPMLLLGALVFMQEAFCFNDSLRLAWVSSTKLMATDEEELIYSLHDGTMYYTSKEFCKNNNISVFSLDLNSKKHAKGISFEYKTEFDPNSLSVNGSYCGFVFYDKIIVFERTKNGTKIQFEAKNDKSFEGCRFINDTIILVYKMYDYHPEDEPICCGNRVIDVKNGTVLQDYSFFLKGIEYSHQVNRWIDFGSDFFTITSPIDFKLFMFRDNRIDTIQLPIEGKRLAKTDSNLLANRSIFGIKSIIGELMRRDSAVNRIEKVFILNDSTVLVSEIFPQSGKNKRALSLVVVSKDNPSRINSIKTSVYNCTFNEDNVVNPDLPFNFQFSLPQFSFNGDLYMVLESYVEEGKRLSDTKKSNYGLYQFKMLTR